MTESRLRIADSRQSPQRWGLLLFCNRARSDSREDLPSFAIMRHKIKKSALSGIKVALCLIILDLVVLLVGFMQIATGEGTGEWSAFWRFQVELQLWLLS